jgi:hypothetical protein
MSPSLLSSSSTDYTPIVLLSFSTGILFSATLSARFPPLLLIFAVPSSLFNVPTNWKNGKEKKTETEQVSV